jgi:hypothetical protein
MKKICWAVSLVTVASLYACGGGGGDISSSTSSSATLTASYPSGVTGASPTSLVTSGSTVVAQIPIRQRFFDWIDTVAIAIKSDDPRLLGRAFFQLIPVGKAIAAPAKVPEGVGIAEFIDKVAAGTVTPTSSNLDLDAFFGAYTSANCYGPNVAYQNHEDGGGNGTLPGGDTGLWLAREGDQTTGTPCSAAQLSRLIDPVKKRMNATMIFGARMRALASSNGGMPAAGAELDLTTQVNSFFQTLLPTGASGTVSNAKISNASGVYTYIVESSATAGPTTLRVVVKVVHDGRNTSSFNGVASYATSKSSDTCGVGGTTVQAGTIRYEKVTDTQMKISAREAPYCSSTAISSNFSAFASVTADDELDPAVTTTQNASTGWQQQGSGFKRFGATYNPSTLAGDFKFAWQAGIGDSHSRMFAMTVAYNSTTNVRTGQSFFGFSGAMTDTSAGATDLKGMICNWAGPSNSHTVNNYFQYQKIVLSETATQWDISSDANSNKISYAPTNNCSSTVGGTMRFDVNADTIVGASEGDGVANSMDTLDAGKTSVQATIEGRGFSNPSLY